MALKSIVYKAELQIANMDAHYYGDHTLTLARHPSETDERMMVRLLAFALHAHEHLEFCKGLSDTDEPDLWQRDLTGRIEKWIDVGQPDERRLLKAAGRADQVWVYAYARPRVAAAWWQQMSGRLDRVRNLSVICLDEDVGIALATLAERTMRLQCTIQDQQVWLSGGQSDPVAVGMTVLRAAAER
jgi:uncharacterized protein YaeQ